MFFDWPHLLPLGLPIILTYILFFHSYWERQRRSDSSEQKRSLMDARYACVAALALDLAQMVALISSRDALVFSATAIPRYTLGLYLSAGLFICHFLTLFFLSNVELRIRDGTLFSQRLWDAYFALFILFTNAVTLSALLSLSRGGT